MQVPQKANKQSLSSVCFVLHCECSTYNIPKKAMAISNKTCLLYTSGKQFEGEWRAVEGSKFYQSPKLYKENGFKNREDAEQLCKTLTYDPLQVIIQKVERKKERKNPPLLFN